jgi:hypothetical protein
MKPTLFYFVETSVFKKQIDKLANVETLFELQNELLKNPRLGDVIQGAGGARKARIGDRRSGRGKSGSFRYIYVYLEKPGVIYLLLFYGKNEQDDLEAEQKREVAEFIKMAKEIWEQKNEK